MFGNKEKLGTIAIAAVVALATAVPAYAQLEEIVVTAQKRTESLQDTPISMAAFDESLIESLGIVQASDISDFTPNIF